MDLQQAIRERHSVRKYTDRPIEPEKAAEALPALRRPDAFVHKLQDNVARIGVHHHVEG